MDSPENSKIVISYNGNYADRIQWSEKKLAKFAKIAALGTKVTIKEGDSQSQSEASNVGGVLAWRRFVNPLEYFGQTTELNDQLRVTTNFDTGEASLLINHHIVTRDVAQRSKGRVDERLFVDQVDGLVNKGLVNILAKEKQRQFLRTLLFHGLHIGLTTTEVGVFAGLGYAFIAFGPSEHLMKLLVQPPPLNGNMLHDFFSNGLDWMTHAEGVVMDYLAGGVLGLGAASFLMKGGLEYITKLKTSKRNLNPLSPIQHFIAGRSYLLTHGRNLAVYSDPNSTNSV